MALGLQDRLSRINTGIIVPPIPHQGATTMAASYSIITYGCQMNEHDSEIMAGLLRNRGMVAGADPMESDVVVINTCTVRDGAENRAMGRVEALSGAKKTNPDMVVAISGCAAQDRGRELLERYPHVDLIIGTRDYVRIDQLVDKVRRSGERFVAIEDLNQPLSLPTIPARENKLRAYVNIMFGCNNKCTFCIVPYTRGTEFSRPLREILLEVEALVAAGYREVCLLGQNVNSYRDAERHDFADLLRAVNAVDGLWRIRYTTSNPKSASRQHLQAIAECDKVMESFHLPVQSGNNRVLRNMKRAYNVERYHMLIKHIAKLCPGSALTTDIIVGFPGETEEEFQDTLRLVEDVRYDSAFMFMYSPRANTPAATLEDQIPLRVKKDRLERLIALQDRITKEIYAAENGRTHQVMVEGKAKKFDQLSGKSRTDKTVVFDGPERLIGSLVDVLIHDGSGHTLIGEVVTQEAGLLAV